MSSEATPEKTEKEKDSDKKEDNPYNVPGITFVIIGIANTTLKDGPCRAIITSIAPFVSYALFHGTKKLYSDWKEDKKHANGLKVIDGIIDRTRALIADPNTPEEDRKFYQTEISRLTKSRHDYELNKFNIK